MFPKELKSS